MQASQIASYHRDYLGYLCRTGQLEAYKIGRNWVTTRSAVERLLAEKRRAAEMK